jgi:hypothetical protein
MGPQADQLLELARERPALAWDPELQAVEAAVLAARGRADEAADLRARARRAARLLGDRPLARALARGR